jgi:flagellar hook-associated protein 1 FlgK
MGLSQVLTAAASGLHATQAGLSIVAGNVANANTPGYVRKSINQVTTSDGGATIGVRVGEVQRELDQYLQKQLRTESGGASYADIRAQFYQQLQGIYGQPGSDTSLDSIFNNFKSTVQALTGSPDDTSARIGVLSSAQVLTQQLNSMSGAVQNLRENAESGIANSVATANQMMQRIADLNSQIGISGGANDAAMATLMDQRDSAIDQLSQILDVNVITGANNQVRIYTSSGLQLVGDKASVLSFDAQGSMSASAQWSADPTQRGVGTITLSTANGTPVDLIQTKSIRSGQLAAYLQLRDQDLVQAQNQLDAIASAMSSALSDKTTAGAPVSAAPQSGFTVDIGSLLAGNTIDINYTDKLTNTQRQITFVRVDDPSVLPLSDTATANGNDKVVGLDFSGGMASVFTQIANALSTTGMVSSNPSGTTLQVLDDGNGGRVSLSGVSTTATITSFGSGNPQMPFFLDGTVPYSGAFSSGGVQSQGFAGRIAVNAAIINDPSLLVKYQTTTSIGDATRPNFLFDQLTDGMLTFNPNSGIGTVKSPFTSTLDGFLQEVIEHQGDAASNADTLKQGQDVVLASLQQRFADASSVNIDSEMANLLNLQNAYAANARVMSAAKAMLGALLNM